MEPRHILLSDGYWLSIGSFSAAPRGELGPGHWAAISAPPGPPAHPAWRRVPRAITLHHLAEAAARHHGHEEIEAIITEAGA